MNNENLKLRTKRFALRIIKMVESLPKDQVSRVLGNQLLRSGTSVGANYRAACRSKSAADFISKMGTVEEEAGELTAIAVASINTVRKSGSRRRTALR